MLVILKPEATGQQREALRQWACGQGLQVECCSSENRSVLLLSGATAHINCRLLEGMEAVETVRRITEPYQRAGRKNHPQNTVPELAPGVSLGGGQLVLIAGPCSVESREQLMTVAQSVKASGAALLRGGAFKPRSSPYDFQGLAREGIRLLLKAKQLTGLPVVSEIVSIEDLPLFEQVDVIQVGARNMQNYDLLKHLGQLRKPVLLKRGPACNLEELLLSAEYLMAGGNEKVILCERGIRTFETYTRNTLDLSAIPLLRELTHLPIVVDPSHATGLARLVPPMALAAAAAGADGIMIEVHNDPPHALSDSAQALTPQEFAGLAARIRAVREAVREEPG